MLYIIFLIILKLHCSMDLVPAKDNYSYEKIEPGCLHGLASQTVIPTTLRVPGVFFVQTDLAVFVL